jgi:hypothetical protein
LSEFYRLLWRQTRQAQLLLIGLAIAIAVLAAVPLYFQQKLINGLAYGTSLHQVLVLGASYAAASLLTIALKLGLQYQSAVDPRRDHRPPYPRPRRNCHPARPGCGRHATVSNGVV